VTFLLLENVCLAPTLTVCMCLFQISTQLLLKLPEILKSQRPSAFTVVYCTV